MLNSTTRPKGYRSPRMREYVAPTLQKVCTKCKRKKVLETEFSRRTDLQRSWASRCKECLAAAGRIRSKRNRLRKIKERWGVEVTWTELMGPCEICGKRQRKKGSDLLCVDHCHEANEYRGLLCSQCNAVLGLMGDEPKTLRSAAQYLERHKKDG